MVNPNKAKGTRTETEIARYASAVTGLHVHRLAQAGALDVGDLGGLPLTALQVKNHAKFDLAGWCDATAAQAQRAGQPYWAVVIKRRGHPAGRAYVLKSLDVELALYRDLVIPHLAHDNP
ncbi:hypothetical protein [Crossiella sp. CA198]|uniref:hypothetical protein n=1 Tax=Crossiella sp. CA198 TaxID=3455607 RepID=UPI003F8D07CA